MLEQSYRTASSVAFRLTTSFKNSPSRRLLPTFPSSVHVRLRSATAIAPLFHPQTSRNVPIRTLIRPAFFALRSLSTSEAPQRDARSGSSVVTSNEISQPPETADESALEFKRTEKGEAAKSVDLTARLKDRSVQPEKGEVIRLLKLAAREWRTLGGNPALRRS